MSCLEQLPFHYDSEVDVAAGQITEISMHSEAHLSRPLLAAMLLELSASSDQRWLCWVADRPLKPLLNSDSYSRGGKILQVVSNTARDLSEIAVRALERGKSHTVAVLLDRPLRADERNALETAAKAGAAECLIIVMQS
ncbi:MAG: cell division inhibitor SulA [Zhongshania sp.]|jgi:cell division inhibitor SulA